MLVLWDPFSNEAIVKLVTVLVYHSSISIYLYIHIFLIMSSSSASPMALRSNFVALFLFTVALSSCLVVSASLVKGKVSCFDCPNDYDYSGIMVSVSCSHTNKRLTITTDKKGEFMSELPSRINSNCEAELQGSYKQLYASKSNVKSKIVKLGEDKYGLSSKLIFLKSCPRSLGSFGSSKTVDLPVPPEWGLAPTSYYLPFIPIIGIP